MTHDPNRKIPNLEDGEPDDGQATLVADTSSMAREAAAVPPPAPSRPQVGIPRPPTPMGVPLAPGSRPQIPGVPSAPGSQPALGRNAPMPGSSLGGVRAPVPMPGVPFGQPAIPAAPGSRPQIPQPRVQSTESELDSTSPTQTSQNLIDASRPKLSKKTQFGLAPPAPFQPPAAPPAPPSQPQVMQPSAHQVAFSPQPHGAPMPAQGAPPGYGVPVQAHTIPLHGQPGFRSAQSTANEFPPQVPGAFPQPQGPDGSPLPPPNHTPAPPSYGMAPPQVDPRFVPSQVRTQPPPAFHAQGFPQGYIPGQPAPGQPPAISPMASGDTVPPRFQAPGDSEPPTLAQSMDDDLRAAIQASKNALEPVSHVNPLGKTVPLQAINPFALPPGIQPPSHRMPLPPPPNGAGAVPPSHSNASYESDMDQTATAYSADHFSHQQGVGYPQNQGSYQPEFAPPPPPRQTGFGPPQEPFSPQGEAAQVSFSAPPHDDATLRKKKWLVAGISAFIALLVGVIGLVAWNKLSAKEEVPPIVSTKGSSAPSVENAAPVDPVATVEPGVATSPKVVDTPKEVPAPQDPIVAVEPTPVEKPEPVKPVTKPAQPVVAPTPTSRPVTVATTTKPVVASKDAFNGAVAKASLQSQTSYFAICNKGGPTGAGRAAVTFGHDGKVAGVAMSPPFAGTPTGDCIAKRLQRASTSPFTSGTGKVDFAFRL